MALELGVDQPLARGRTPLWLDADSDGLLDLVLLNSKRPDGRAPSSIYHQLENNSFVEANDKFAFRDPNRSRMDKFKDLLQNLNNFQLGLPPVIYGNKRFSILSDITGDGIMELISFAPMRINKIKEIPFDDITYDYKLPNVRDVKDVAIADFNGDQNMDMYITRSKEPADTVFSKKVLELI